MFLQSHFNNLSLKSHLCLWIAQLCVFKGEKKICFFFYTENVLITTGNMVGLTVYDFPAFPEADTLKIFL